MNQASVLATESNDLYDIVQGYRNTSVPEVDALLAAYAIDPATCATAHLGIKDKWAVVMGLTPVLAEMAREGCDRKVEANLAAGGYADIAAAIADVPQHFTDGAATIIDRNLTQTAALTALLDDMVDDDLLYQIVSRIVAIRNKIVEAAGVMDRV